MKQFEIIWSYFQQDRTDSFQVYVWSRLVLDSRREMGETPADRRAALEGHLARMKRMEELIRKIRRLGFGRSSDVGASQYYRLEAEHWLARAGGEEVEVHRPAGPCARPGRAAPGRAALTARSSPAGRRR